MLDYEGLVISGILAQIHITGSSLGPQIYPMFIFSVLKFIISMFTLESWQNCCVNFLVCRVKSATVEKAKMKFLKLLPHPICPQKSRQYIKSHITYWKILLPPLVTYRIQRLLPPSHIHLIHYSDSKNERSWKITVDDYHSNKRPICSWPDVVYL